MKLSRYRKAIAGLVTPVVTALVALNVLPEVWATPEVITGITAIVTGIAVERVPNEP